MTMKGLITHETPLILTHNPKNTIRYSLKRLITNDEMGQYEGSWPPVRSKWVCLGYSRTQGTGIRDKALVLGFLVSIAISKYEIILFHDLDNAVYLE